MSKSIRSWIAALAVSALAACAAEAPPVAHAPPAVPASAVPGQGHWLIGTWTGDLQGRRIAGSTVRTLRVTAVDPTGTSATGRYAGADVAIRISGSTISFISAASQPIELAYTAPATLAGTAGTGQTGVTYLLSLQRQATSAR